MPNSPMTYEVGGKQYLVFAWWRYLIWIHADARTLTDYHFLTMSSTRRLFWRPSGSSLPSSGWGVTGRVV